MNGDSKAISPGEIQINNSAYWDHRFEGDWEEKGGREQSAFFSAVAFEHLPVWMKRFMVSQQPSFCDWGCALGDGTDYLRRSLALKDVWGIDFSATSVEKAKAVYPGVRFVHTDLTKDDFEQVFDVIFSSNTLEHFYDPWAILTTISRFAARHLIVLVPYQEYELCSKEHFYTFDAHNIPVNIGDTFFLTHSTVIDTSNRPLTQWFGKQILLIYTHQQQTATLFLDDIEIAKRETSAKVSVPEVVQTSQTDRVLIDSLNAIVDAQKGEPAEHQVKLHEKEVTEQGLNQTISSLLLEKETLAREAATMQSDFTHQLITQKDYYEAALQNLQQTAAASAEQCSRLERSKQDAEEQLKELIKDLARLQQQHEDFKKVMEENGKETLRLQELNEELQAKFDAATMEKEVAAQLVRQSEQEVIALTSEKNSYYQASVGAKADAQLLEEKLAALQHENNQLNTRQAALQKRVRQIEQSRSWQATKPFRSMVHQLKKTLSTNIK